MAEFINTVDVIGDEALTNSIIDKSVTEYKDNNIGKVRNYAFRGCNLLANVESPTAVSVGVYAFMDCAKLTSADFPVATSISTEAFHGCSSLATINLPAVTSISSYAFYECSSLVSADFPLVTLINNQTFYGCSSLASVNFPAATSIGQYAFYGCSSLVSADFPSATSIDTYVFNRCSKLTSINAPLVTSIKAQTFNQCSELTSINAPLATSIDNYAFSNCSSLVSVDFPLVTSIGNSAFSGCFYLTALILRSETMCTLSSSNAFTYCHHILGNVNTYNPTGAKDGYIYVPRALVESYKAATNWSTYASQFRAIEDWTVDGTVTGELNIEGRYMVRFFDEDGTLLDYVIVSAGEDAVYTGEDPVKEGEWAFTGFSPSPTNVTADMDCYAQFKSTALASSKIVQRNISGDYFNDGAGKVGSHAFFYCGSLTSVKFTKATSVEDSGFDNCSALTRADFSVLTSLKAGAFRDSPLDTLIIRTPTVCSIPTSIVINGPIANGAGYIYVPAALVNSYKSSSGWSRYANQFRAIEDYPEICGGDE